MRLEISKRAKDRVILLPADVDLSDARVEAFVLHCPKAWLLCARGESSAGLTDIISPAELV